MALPSRSVLADVDGHVVELTDRDDPMGLIESLGTGDWWRVFCMIDADGVLFTRLNDRDDGFSVAGALGLVRSMCEALTGYRWYTACSLSATAVSDWSAFDGLAAWRGFDPWEAPVSRSLALVHHCLKSSRETPGDVARLEYQLAGPEAESDPSVGSAKLEAAAFSEWSAYFTEDGTALNGGVNA